jgi:hypothetical protein
LSCGELRAPISDIPHGWSAERLRPRCQGFVDAFLTERNAFVLANQEILLAALQGDSALEAVRPEPGLAAPARGKGEAGASR